MIFDLLLPIAILSIVLIGHFGIWIALYNRINATGIERKTIKRIEKGIVLACGLIPILILVLEFTTHGLDATLAGLTGGEVVWQPLTIAYAWFAGMAAMAMAPFWIRDRPQFAIAKGRQSMIHSEDLHPLKQDRNSAAVYLQGGSFRRMSRLPGNQIASMQRNRKRLTFSSMPQDLNGLKIAHISDVHLTGQLSIAYYRLAMDWVMNSRPDLIVVSGDIVDYEHALAHLKPVFSGLSAPLGMYFILGNHDRRLLRPTTVCDRLQELDWIDLGTKDAVVDVNQTRIRLLGNEKPWFQRNKFGNELPVDLKTPSGVANPFWTIGVSHSPDQWRWGMENRCQLMLCGHTHGGQIRFPLIGPVISPSWFGSRYASGVFLKGETLIHVSRGLSGVHPFRWGCLPEVTILELST